MIKLKKNSSIERKWIIDSILWNRFFIPQI